MSNPANPGAISKVRGHILTTPAAGSATTSIQVSQDDGYLVGVSVAAPYIDGAASAARISVSAGNARPIDAVPLSQLVPVAGQPFFRLPGFVAPGTEVTITLTAGLPALEATKVVSVIFHYAK